MAGAILRRFATKLAAVGAEIGIIVVVKRWSPLVVLGGLVSCSPAAPSSGGGSSSSGTEGPGSSGPTAATSTGSPATTTGVDGGSESESGSGSSGGDVPPPSGPTLEIDFLGVGGVALRSGDDVVITAPLYSNPSLLETTVGTIEPRPDVIDRFLPLDRVADAKAILVGHGHYDHLLDVPYVWTKTDDAMIYGNRSVAWLLAGFAEVPPERVAVLNDPLDPLVDRRSCADPDMCTAIPAGHEGAWVPVPGVDVRLRALCSSHPAQFLGVVHFGEGCMAAPTTEPLAIAGQWLEGATLAYLIDFLAEDGSVRFRVYYQDAPTEAPVGLPVPELLEEHRVDLAILNVGSFDAVPDRPEAAIAAMDPRYVIGVHWENFFITQAQGIEPIPFHPNPAEFDTRALAALGDEEQPPMVIDGVEVPLRYLRPWPGTRVELVGAP